MDALDPLIHQPLRTQIVAFLAGAKEVTFTELRQTLDVSDGNLESHLKKLIAADYVAVRKESGTALQNYVTALQTLLTPHQTISPTTFNILESGSG